MSGIFATAYECFQNRDKFKGVFDCSGFVKYCYEKNGIKTVPPSSSSIWRDGKKGDGSIGDIACWNGHVGICDGKGNVIHSYHKGMEIVAHSISKISEPNWSGPLLGYRRYSKKKQKNI